MLNRVHLCVCTIRISDFGKSDSVNGRSDQKDKELSVKLQDKGVSWGGWRSLLKHWNSFDPS